MVPEKMFFFFLTSLILGKTYDWVNSNTTVPVQTKSSHIVIRIKLQCLEKKIIEKIGI